MYSYGEILPLPVWQTQTNEKAVFDLSDAWLSLSAPLLTLQLCLYSEKGQKIDVSQIYFQSHIFCHQGSHMSFASIAISLCWWNRKNSEIWIYFNIYCFDWVSIIIKGIAFSRNRWFYFFIKLIHDALFVFMMMQFRFQPQKVFCAFKKIIQRNSLHLSAKLVYPMFIGELYILPQEALFYQNIWAEVS